MTSCSGDNKQIEAGMMKGDMCTRAEMVKTTVRKQFLRFQCFAYYTSYERKFRKKGDYLTSRTLCLKLPGTRKAAAKKKLAVWKRLC